MSATHDKEYSYGEKISFLDGEMKKLVDFRIRFLGTRKVESSVYRHGFIYYEFEVVTGAERKKIEWSSGTGDIAPLDFNIGGAQYVLELQQSAVYAGLDQGEMLLWRHAEYETARKAKWPDQYR